MITSTTAHSIEARPAFDDPYRTRHVTVAPDAMDDEDFALGVVRLNAERSVTYVNRAATRMTGGEIRIGRNIAELELDEPSRIAVAREYSRRLAGRGSSYRIRFRRADLGTYVRILISAVPEYDATGACVSAIGYLIDESLDAATLAIHQVIASANNREELLAAMTKSLHEVVAFDSLIVTGVSRKRRHLSRVFEDPPPAPDDRMWWPMPPFIKSMIDGCEVGPLDLDEFFTSPEFVEYEKTDVQIRMFRERGFKHCLRIGVIREKDLVAMISLLRTENRPYTNEDAERCRRLPLNEAVISALTFGERRDMRFGTEFVRTISLVSDDYKAIGQVLVDTLARHYGWSHVSLFRLDRQHENFSLVCQAGRGPDHIREGYTQPSCRGFLGLAYRTRKPVNVGTVQDPEYAEQYYPILAETRAEMVLPIPGTDGRWLLNVESNLRDAFADEEQDSVELQLQIAGFILERVASLEMKTAILKSVADAVIHTNDDNVIVDLNPAALAMLALPAEQVLNRSLTDLLAVDSSVVPIEALGAVTAVPAGSSREVTFALNRIVDRTESLPVKIRRGDGVFIPVLMSAAPLPERLGGKVFVASDLREQNRIQEMKVINNVFQQLVSEIRVPLALSEAFLGDALHRTRTAATRELIDKAIRQMHKVDIPLERVMRFAARDQDAPLPRLNFDLRDAVRRLVAEFPESDAGAIRLANIKGEIPVQAPRHELMFCIRSLLTYLMRRKAQLEKVDIGMARDGSKAVVSLTIPQLSEHGTDLVADGDAESDLEMWLAKPVLSKLMKHMGGGYKTLANGHRGFELQFEAE